MSEEKQTDLSARSVAANLADEIRNLASKAELETQIKASKEAAINVPNLERFIEDVRSDCQIWTLRGSALP